MGGQAGEHVGGQVGRWAGESAGRWADSRTFSLAIPRSEGGMGGVGAEVGEGR